MSKDDRELIARLRVSAVSADMHIKLDNAAYIGKPHVAMLKEAATRLEALQAQPVGEDKLLEIANRAVKENLNPDGTTKYRSAQGYACALSALRLAALTASPPVVEREAIEKLWNEHIRLVGMDDGYAMALGKDKFFDAILALTPVEGVVERRMLLDLLATIHRDGGQHVDSVGIEQATADAIQLSAERIVQSDGSEAYRNCATMNRQMAGTIGAQPGSSIFAALEACAERMDEIALSTPVAQGDEVRDALEPFARAAKNIPAKFADDRPVKAAIELTPDEAKAYGDVVSAQLIVSFDGISAGDFRNALATLTKGARDAG